MKTILSSAILGLLFCVVPAVDAAFTATAADTRQIMAEQRQIREDLEESSGRYSRFDEATQMRLRGEQSRIFSLLEGGRTLEQMNPQEQAALLNSVEQVKAILADNEDDMLKCWREKKIGSQMKITRCATLSEIRQTREDARAFKSDVGTCQMGSDGGPRYGPSDLRPSMRGY